jgi:CBS domain-containing protein
VVRGDLPLGQLAGLAGFLFLTLVAIGSGMGSMGVWWPTWLLGASLAAVFLAVAPAEWVSRGFLPNAALLGAVAFGAVWLKTPISLAVLAYEFTQNGSLLLPSLVAASLARWIYLKVGESAWVDQLLVSKGFPIEDGRAVAVLQALKAGDAMVRNFDTVDERDSVRSCHEKIRSCHYPFLPVVDVHGRYKGLLTVDLIEEVLFSDESGASQLQLEDEGRAREKLGGLLEAKDLLYRSGIQTPAVDSGTSLAEVAVRIRGQSCLPVVDSENRVVGLLFDHDIRQCYDREVARRSFVMQAGQNSQLQRRRARDR